MLRADCDLRENHRRLVAAHDPEKPLIASELKTLTTAEPKGMLTTFDGRTESSAIRFLLEAPFPEFDQAEDGTWAVASARCKPGMANLKLLSSDGIEIRRFPVGDGIEHIQFDANGDLWVGYFDEGIFGNDDWVLPDHEFPLPCHGLVRFDRGGRVLWTLGDSSMADCYALNVCRDKVWTYYYTDFPILEIDIRTGKIIRRETGLAGGNCLAVDDRHALLAGENGAAGVRLVLLRLEGGTARAIATADFAPSDSRAARPQLRAGRSDTIHFIADGVWSKITVADACNWMLR
jgi:hypothetical protein